MVNFKEINLLKLNKRFLIVFSVLLVVLVLLISLFVLSSPKPKDNIKVTPSPTILEEKIPYNPTDLESDFQRIKNREPLSSSDLESRRRIISGLNNTSGIAQTSNTYKIEYVKTADVFMVEIIDKDASKGKKEATEWFKGQGISNEGICNLPAIFYLSKDVADYYKESNQVFNPIPEGCQ